MMRVVDIEMELLLARIHKDLECLSVLMEHQMAFHDKERVIEN